MGKKLSENLRVNFTAEERAAIKERAENEARSVASVIRLATLAYLKERK